MSPNEFYCKLAERLIDSNLDAMRTGALQTSDDEGPEVEPVVLEFIRLQQVGNGFITVKRKKCSPIKMKVLYTGDH